LPTIASLPAVPTIVAWLPAQVGAEAVLQTGGTGGAANLFTGGASS
jgi:hypothetical protein